MNALPQYEELPDPASGSLLGPQQSRSESSAFIRDANEAIRGNRECIARTTKLLAEYQASLRLRLTAEGTNANVSALTAASACFGMRPGLRLITPRAAAVIAEGHEYQDGQPDQSSNDEEFGQSGCVPDAHKDPRNERSLRDRDQQSDDDIEDTEL